MRTSSDNEYEEKRLNDNVYEMQAVESPHAEVVFFPGLPMDLSDASNAFWKTWTQRDTDKFWPVTMLPKYLNGGNQVPGFDIRVLAVTYDSRSNIPSDIGVAGTDDYLLSENLVKNLILNPKARVAGVGQGYDVPVILVGHDLGGILIKQLILHVEKKCYDLDEGEEKEKLTKFLTNLTSVFFYSTPHNGSAAIEKLMNKIPADNRSALLTFMTVLGKEMARVNAFFTEYRRPRLNERPRFKTFAINAGHFLHGGSLSRGNSKIGYRPVLHCTSRSLWSVSTGGYVFQ
ncbi:hypothetical protein Mapa_017334 [Marchantia paleacea]|nr:hypothetical protein Mapa_017334 [Marchantia paleacea]